jgi:hypothetical protein
MCIYPPDLHHVVRGLPPSNEQSLEFLACRMVSLLLLLYEAELIDLIHIIECNNATRRRGQVFEVKLLGPRQLP